MNIRQTHQFLLVIFITITPVLFATAEESLNYYAPENVRKFADSLYEQGDYRRAASEYQRYLFSIPAEDAAHAEIRYKIAHCYRLAGDGAQAIRNFEPLLRTHFANRVYYQIGATYFLMDEFEQAARFLNEALPQIADIQHRTEAEALVGLSYLMQKRWAETDEIFRTLQGSEVIGVKEKASVYRSYAAAGAQLPRRSPFLAGVFSTLLPGAGRLYTGRLGDALTSLLTLGLMSWQTYDGFRRDGLSSVKGWTFGIIGGAFYVGNIYGSVISARVYNRYIEDEFLTTLSIELPY